jgi:hypothetical protein
MPKPTEEVDASLANPYRRFSLRTLLLVIALAAVSVQCVRLELELRKNGNVMRYDEDIKYQERYLKTVLYADRWEVRDTIGSVMEDVEQLQILVGGLQEMQDATNHHINDLNNLILAKEPAGE